MEDHQSTARSEQLPGTQTEGLWGTCNLLQRPSRGRLRYGERGPSPARMNLSVQTQRMGEERQEEKEPRETKRTEGKRDRDTGAESETERKRERKIQDQEPTEGGRVIGKEVQTDKQAE